MRLPDLFDTPDIGHTLADEELEKLEKKFAKVYKKAQTEIEKKANDYFKQFDKADKEKQKLVKQGRMTEGEYKLWRMSKMATGDRWAQLRDEIAEHYTNTNRIAAEEINRTMPGIFAENYNYSNYMMHNLGSDASFVMHDENTVRRLIAEEPNLLPYKSVDGKKTVRWNKKKVTSAVTQGIVQGESIPHLAKRLRTVTEMNRKSAIRNARTAVTGAENAGRMRSYYDAEKLGIKVAKQWVATLDGRTRHAHRELDGEIVEKKEKFENSLGEIRYPGDPEAEPANVYNCRCTMIPAIDGHHIDLSPRVVGTGEDYEEWKSGYSVWESKPKKTTTKIIQGGNSALDKVAQRYDIEWRQVKTYDKQPTDEEIIKNLAGGDMTEGSCSSLAFAYAGNMGGYDVRDFRGGTSRQFFSMNTTIDKISVLPGVDREFARELSDLAAAEQVLKAAKEGKQYYFATGRHAAVVKMEKGDLWYLEMQSQFDENNTWHRLKGEGVDFKKKLKNRFSATVRKGKYKRSAWLIDIDSLKDNDDFLSLLGYINTAPDKQKKGHFGGIR